MSVDAGELKRQEQTLLACRESLRAAAAKAAVLRDGIRQAWRSEETAYLLEALDRVLSELEREGRLTETLAGDISDKGARLRVEAELLRETLFLEGGDGLF